MKDPYRRVISRDGARRGEWARKCRHRIVSARCGFSSEDVYYAFCPICGRKNVMQGVAPSWSMVESCEHLTRHGFRRQGTYLYFEDL